MAIEAGVLGDYVSNLKTKQVADACVRKHGSPLTITLHLIPFIRISVVSLVAYVLAYFPGGTQTLRLGGSLALRGAGSLLPR